MINQLGVNFPWLAPIAVLLAEYSVLLLPVVFIAYWLSGVRHYRIMLISALFAFVLAEVIGRLLGLLHENFQPFYYLQGVNQLIEHAVDNSFPSDHSLLFFSISVSFFYFKAHARYLWLLLAALVGISRIVVGVHYPFDVFVGASVGAIAAVWVGSVLPQNALFLRLYQWQENIEQACLARLGFRKK